MGGNNRESLGAGQLSEHPREKMVRGINPDRQLEMGSLTGERFPETRTRLLTLQDVEGWPLEKLRYAINEMFARHGADFVKEEIKRVFLQSDWYQPLPGKSYDAAEVEFSEVEKENVKILGEMRSRLIR